jgi:tricarballylate dehydrogenase
MTLRRRRRAQEAAPVLVLDRSDVVFRGGNSRHTRNVRCVHGDDFAYNSGAYTYEELWKDLCGWAPVRRTSASPS